MSHFKADSLFILQLLLVSVLQLPTHSKQFDYLLHIHVEPTNVSLAQTLILCLCSRDRTTTVLSVSSKQLYHIRREYYRHNTPSVVESFPVWFS